MAPQPLIPNPENASLRELKEAGKVGTFETGTRCNAIQMLVVGIPREQVCRALRTTERSLLTWTHLSNECGVDGLIVNKRPGRPHIIGKKRRSSLVISLATRRRRIGSSGRQKPSMGISAVPMRSSAVTRPSSVSSMNKGMPSRYLSRGQTGRTEHYDKPSWISFAC